MLGVYIQPRHLCMGRLEVTTMEDMSLWCVFHFNKVFYAGLAFRGLPLLILLTRFEVPAVPQTIPPLTVRLLDPFATHAPGVHWVENVVAVAVTFVGMCVCQMI
jgi:hypothetical protein